jgi:hypothetical protein
MESIIYLAKKLIAKMRWKTNDPMKLDVEATINLTLFQGYYNTN